MNKKMNFEIGDYVYFHGEIVKVDMLSNSDVTLSVANENGSMCAIYKNIKPIPITPEILEKNGFEFIEEDDEILYYACNTSKHRCIANLRENSPMNLIVSSEMININIYVTYVHELQHALRLCNIDKEIEL